MHLVLLLLLKNFSGENRESAPGSYHQKVIKITQTGQRVDYSHYCALITKDKANGSGEETKRANAPIENESSFSDTK